MVTLGAASLTLTLPANAQFFDETEIDQNAVVAVAEPYGEVGKTNYNLILIEQVPGKQPACWGESGSGPVQVDPLLLNFDFSGVCRRATDSNGYSVRIDGQDLGQKYLLRIAPRNGELVLVATPRERGLAELLIGRSYGSADGFLKIFLDPAWRFTRRTYQGKALGHTYLSSSSSQLNAPETLPAGDDLVTPSSPNPLPAVDGNVTPPIEPTTLPAPVETPTTTPDATIETPAVIPEIIIE